jgi:hypothetical protein
MAWYQGLGIVVGGGAGFSLSRLVRLGGTEGG